MADGSVGTTHDARADLDAEAAVLAAALLSEDAALEAVELLRPEEFYADANRLIFEAIRKLATSGSTIDAVAVAGLLRAEGRLERVGGTPYVAQLADATPSVAHVAEHARIVRGWCRVRKAALVFSQIAAEAKGAPMPDVDQWLESCEARAYTVTAVREDSKPVASPYRELAQSAYDRIAESLRIGRKTLGRNSGFRTIDEHLGGLSGGELVFIAGRPGSGKTALALQIAENIAKDRSDAAAAVVLSQEMPRDGLMLRSLARTVGTSSRELRSGSVDWSALGDAVTALGQLPIIIDDEPRLTPMRMRAKIRRHAATLRLSHPGVPLGLVVIDYVQLMTLDERRKDQTRADELGQISREMKILAKELDCTFLVLSQLRRPERGKTVPRPELSDLRDSGSLEADADVVMGIHRADEYRKPGEQFDGLAEIGILKGRNSGGGWHMLKFDGPSTKFSDLDMQESADYAMSAYD